MCRHAIRPRLPVFLISAALFSVPSGLPAQQAPTPETPTVPPAARVEHPPVTPAQAQPNFHPTPEDIGDSYLARKRYQAAIQAYKQAPKNSAHVWNKMGIAYQMMFNEAEAIHCYRQSLKLDPRDPRVYNNLGTIYDSAHELRAAEKMYRKSLKLDPKAAIVLKNLGTNLITQHKYEKGWEQYKKALALDPEIFQQSSHLRVENAGSVEQRGAMNFYMAKGCLRAGMTECAIDYLRKALNEGYTTPKKIVADEEFSALRGVPAFEQMLAGQTKP